MEVCLPKVRVLRWLSHLARKWASVLGVPGSGAGPTLGLQVGATQRIMLWGGTSYEGFGVLL